MKKNHGDEKSFLCKETSLKKSKKIVTKCTVRVQEWLLKTKDIESLKRMDWTRV